ncbi:MAG: YihY/virulence factor BrkB family protein [Muricomes sp.]
MRGKTKKIVKELYRLGDVVGSHHTGAYAAQSAYFFVLSLIPIILLLFTMVQFTPLTKMDVMEGVMQIFPKTVEGTIVSIINQVYAQSRSIIPVTIIVALWSAGKGVLSVTSGLNCIYDNIETRNYLYLRLRASVYTVVFILAIALSLTLSVFGNSISVLVYRHVPFFITVMDAIIKIRTFLTLIVLTLFWDLVYKFLPNRDNLSKTTMKQQLPGAVFTSCGWLLASFIFSMYLDIFTGFTSMYGSLTTIILIMLWLYVCMYVILLGGELNAILEGYGNRREDFE